MDSGQPLRGFRNDEACDTHPARQWAVFQTHGGCHAQASRFRKPPQRCV